MGDEMNLLMAAAAFNFKRLLRKIKQESICALDFWMQKLLARVEQFTSNKIYYREIELLRID